MIIIGLTGSMATGKSALIQQIRQNLRWPIWDADAQVQKLYQSPEVIEKIGEYFPEAKEKPPAPSPVNLENKSKFQINRQILRRLLSNNSSGLPILEGILHPLLAIHRHKFLMRMTALGQKIVVLDIPLLFEKHLEAECDIIVVTNCSDQLQKQRILSRPGMTFPLMNQLLAHQIPLQEKMKMADIVVETGLNKRHSWTMFCQKLQDIIKEA